MTQKIRGRKPSKVDSNRFLIAVNTPSEQAFLFPCGVILFTSFSLLFGFYPIWGENDTRQGINSSNHSMLLDYRDLLSASLVILIPLLLDILFSTAEALVVARDRREKFNCLCRWLIMLFLAIPNIVFCSIAEQSSGTLSSKAYLCCEKFKFVASISSVVILVAQYRDSRLIRLNSRTGLKTQSSIILLLAGCFQACSVAAISSSAHDKSLFTASAVFLYVTFCLFFVFFSTIVINWKCELHLGDLQVTQNDISVTVCLILLLLKLIGDISLYAQSPIGVETISSDTIRQKMLLQLAFDVSIIWLPPRLEQSMFIQFLKATLDDKSSLMRYVSHELRTPLNINLLSVNFVKSEIRMLKAVLGPNRTAVIADALVDMETSCTTAVSILDDFLTFDKIKSAKLVMELKEKDPIVSLRSSYRQFLLVAEENEIDFRFVTDAEPDDQNWILRHSIRIDGLKFGQVMRNLLSNALKFTPRGGRVVVKLSMTKQQSTNPMLRQSGRRSWSFSSRRRSIAPVSDAIAASENWLRVEVIDSGAGISKEDQKKLFGQYVQFNANKLQKGKGSGLGLWISKGIMALHGGRLWAESEGEGLGSRFVVELPLFPRQPGGGVLSEGSSSDNSIMRFIASSNFAEPSMLGSVHSNYARVALRDNIAVDVAENDQNDRLESQPCGHFPSPSIRSLIQDVMGMGIGSASSQAKRAHSSGHSPSHSSRNAAGSDRVKAVVSPFVSPFGSGLNQSKASRSGVPSGGGPGSGSGSGRSGHAEAPAAQVELEIGAGGGETEMVITNSFLREMGGGSSSVSSFAAGKSQGEIRLAGYAHKAFSTDKFGKATTEQATRASEMVRSEGEVAVGPPGRTSVAPPGPLAHSMWANGLRFLVVDDSSANRRVLGRLLDTNKHTTSFASSGKEFLELMEASLSSPAEGAAGGGGGPGAAVVAAAVDSIEDATAIQGADQTRPVVAPQTAFDVVLMDHHMPGLSGPKAVQKIRERGYKGLIVGLTGDTLDDDMDYFKAHGVDAVLPKPLKLEELKEVVCAWFQRNAGNKQESCSAQESAGADGQGKEALGSPGVAIGSQVAPSVHITGAAVAAGSFQQLQLPPIAEESQQGSLRL